jgi:hypothetical protein
MYRKEKVRWSYLDVMERKFQRSATFQQPPAHTIFENIVAMMA